ncbi:hypothetical protein [Escherichia coli]|uniref:hypothetical protein n=1 Tax=Escherichia coli TaxID=562 RepID=UPI0019184F46|nr:hypothetical protein [Escherichia coli]CAD6036901.1 Uncharacterised protein [Escherichia coli]CAD6099040.1 Uncharacterised protein [Escherichia coli]CAD6176378.1 Uncharacterised protein [Escherichia coli]
MKQKSDSFGKIPFDEMSEEEILALFGRYEFKDKHGHDLLNCVEFGQLVDYVLSSRD